MAVYAIDFESYYDDALNVSKMGPIAYSLATDIYLVSVAGEDGLRFVGHPHEAPWDDIAGAGNEWVSHNRTFDKACFMALFENHEDALPDRWHCTADLVAYLGVSRSLAKSSEVLLGVEPDKSTRAKMKGKHWPHDFKEALREEVLKYALVDSELCLRLWLEHGHKWPELERRLSEHTTLMTHRGIYADTPAIVDGINRLERELFRIEKKIPWANETDDKGKPVPVTSPKQLKTACDRLGIPAPASLAKDAPDFAVWLKEYGDRAPFAEAFGQWRSINRTLQELTKFHAYTVEGRIRYDLKYFGGHCVTGDHEVLTKSGWQRLDEWQGGRIAQWAPDGRITFDEATPNAFDINERVAELNAPFYRGVFTLGHKFPCLTKVGVQLIECGKVARKRSQTYLPVAGDLVTDASYTSLSPNQMRLLVAIQADGHWTRDNILQFCLRKGRKIRRIIGLLEALGIAHRRQVFKSQPDQMRISVSRRHCEPWFYLKKTFGPHLLDASRASRQAFIDELKHWDGWEGANHWEYYSSDRESIEWAATICHLTGQGVAISERKGRKASHAPGWTLCNRTRSPRRTMVYGKHFKTPYFIGRVYCPTTRTGMFLFRFDGRIGVTGNTGRWSGGSKDN